MVAPPAEIKRKLRRYIDAEDFGIAVGEMGIQKRP